jgi:hypothetical protein
MPRNFSGRLDSVAAPDDPTAALMLDFLEWLTPDPRPYAEVMEVWRTSCPRLTVWEDAIDRGYVVRKREGQGPVRVRTTPLGDRYLSEGGRPDRRWRQAAASPVS